MFNFLMPKDTAFFDLFEKMSGHVVSAAASLGELCEAYPNPPVIQKIRDTEHAADQIAHEVLARLDQAFITPFDREDIYQLVNRMDDVIDEIDALAKRLPIFHVDSIPAPFRSQAALLRSAAAALDAAVRKLRAGVKLARIQKELIEIHDCESKGDDTHHEVMSILFSGGVAEIDVLRWKELYDILEQAIDRCEDVGNTLEHIALKNG
jgi:predicted phosphate transport protein (TIGR00153 family)